MDKLTKRRETEGPIYERLGQRLLLKRPPMKKQKKYREKVKMVEHDYSFLQYSHLVRTWALKNNDLTPRELDALLYLHPLGIFTRAQLDEALLELSFPHKTMYAKFIKDGWISEWAKRGRRTFYSLTYKGNELVNRMHRMHLFEERIPTSSRRNEMAKKKTKSDKVLMDLITKFNKKVTENKS